MQALSALWCFPQKPHFRNPQDDVWQALWRAGISEFFACLIFIFIGTGAVVASQDALGDSRIPVPSLTLISLAHGFCIMVLVYAIGEISGGHINPAVTWAAAITGRISILRFAIYWSAQLLGAIVGSALLKGVVPVELQFGMGCHEVNILMTNAQGFGAEVIFTFIFIFVVFATAISPFSGKVAPLAGSDYGPGKLTPFAVGMTILCLHTVGIPLTGASMNPARSFGPAVVNNCWKRHWIYWVGPLFGSTLAAVIAQLLFLSNPEMITKFLRIRQSSHTGPAKPYGSLEDDH